MTTRFAAPAWLFVVTIVACSSDDLTEPRTQLTKTIVAYDIVDLGMQGMSTQAFGIDDHGTVYGRHALGPGLGTSSFRWTARDGFEDLGDVDGFPFQFLGSNKDGDLAGWVPTTPIGTPGIIRPVIWTAKGGFQYIDDPAYNGQAWSVNKHGQVAGSRNLPGIGGVPQRGFVWSERAGMTIIEPHPSVMPGRSSAGPINDRGVVAGITSFKATPTAQIIERAFLWDGSAALHLLPSLGGIAMGVTDLNDDEVVVGAGETRAPLPGEIRRNVLSFNPGDVPVHAWRWSAAGGLQDLGTLGGMHSVAWAVDVQGNAYGWAMNASGQQRAVKWTTTGEIIELGTLGGNISSTGGVNKHGVVAGQAATASGDLHGVIYVPR